MLNCQASFSKSRLSHAFLAAICAGLLAIHPGGSARADNETPSNAQANTDRDRLKAEASELKQKLADFNKAVEADLKSLEASTDPATARKRVEDLQSQISDALSATADNGKIGILAQKVLDTQRAWLADAKNHHFAPEREAFIEGNLKTILDETQKTVDGVHSIRKALTEQLKTLQGEQDYMEQLERINQSKEMLAVMQHLLQQLKETSDYLNVLMSGIPGA